MPFPPLHVLVPVALGFDEDPMSAELLVEAACDIAHLDATLHLVFVHSAMTPMIGFDVGLAPAAYYQSLADIEEREHEHATKQLHQLAARVGTRGRHALAEVIGPLDGVGESIIDAATRHHADLIVLWSHGRRGLKRLFLGSVAERVAHLAPMSVLILRGPSPG